MRKADQGRVGIYGCLDRLRGNGDAIMGFDQFKLVLIPQQVYDALQYVQVGWEIKYIAYDFLAVRARTYGMMPGACTSTVWAGTAWRSWATAIPR